MRTLFPLAVLLISVLQASAEQPTAEQIAAFQRAAQLTEAHLHDPLNVSLPPNQLHLDNLSSGTDVAGALLHHWRGTLVIPGARAADFEHLLHSFTAYPQVFAPEVVSASASPSLPGHTIATLRIRQHHVLTVVMDQSYDVTFPSRGLSISRSSRVDELTDGHPGESHGFLWRQNTYWRWADTPAGLLLQLESLSLSRSIPTGLAWAVRPFVDSIPRESLTFTLNAAATALRHEKENAR